MMSVTLLIYHDFFTRVKDVEAVNDAGQHCLIRERNRPRQNKTHKLVYYPRRRWNVSSL